MDRWEGAVLCLPFFVPVSRLRPQSAIGAAARWPHISRAVMFFCLATRTPIKQCQVAPCPNQLHLRKMCHCSWSVDDDPCPCSGHEFAYSTLEKEIVKYYLSGAPRREFLTQKKAKRGRHYRKHKWPRVIVVGDGNTSDVRSVAILLQD